MKTILITGGAGYIGSHVALKLLEINSQILILDNFCNSKIDVINKIELISSKNIKFFRGDISDRNLMKNIFQKLRLMLLYILRD